MHDGDDGLLVDEAAGSGELWKFSYPGGSATHVSSGSAEIQIAFATSGKLYGLATNASFGTYDAAYNPVLAGSITYGGVQLTGFDDAASDLAPVP